MAIPKEVLGKMTVEERDSYIKMRQALDSLTNVALTEFDLSVPENFTDPEAVLSDTEAKRKQLFDAHSNEDTKKEISDSTRKQISGIVLKGVEKLIEEIGEARGPLWSVTKPDRAADFAAHSRILSEEEFKKSGELSEIEAQELLDAEFLRGNDGSSCPPGFILVDGICVLI